ncbi:hypothetical protein KA005_57210, partial [bacterium]|nr:hypothetical protein [bacterium]
RHKVSQKHAETNPYIWRANLLGGGRLLDISQRLRDMPTFAEHIQQQGWDYGEGFIPGKKKKGRKETRKTAPFLTGKPFLPTKAFTDKGIDEIRIGTVTETLFESPRKKERFDPPLVLIKKSVSLPVTFWDKGFLSYRHRIVGIHAPRSRASELRSFYESFLKKHDIYRFCCTLYGTESLTSKATAIRKQDIDLLPYPKDQTDLSFSFWEEAIQSDVLKYMADCVRLGQKSELLRKSADENDLKKYSKMFIKMLGSVYDNLRASDPVFLDGLIYQPFYFGDLPNLSWLNRDSEDELRKLVYYKNNDHLRTLRIFRLYTENVMLIVKPDRLRYWIRSTAIRDADETLIDLRNQGY